MPFYKNGSLKKLLDNRFLSPREIIRYALQFLTGLNNIHTKRLIHFDIKPDNILISDTDEALVSDFGLAKAMNTIGQAEQDAVYSKHLPLEMLAGNEHSIPYDIYMCGLTLYRMANGNTMFDQQFNQAIAKGLKMRCFMENFLIGNIIYLIYPQHLEKL